MASLVRWASDRGGPEPFVATPAMSNLPLLLLGFATGVGVLQLQAALPRWPFGIMAAALFALVVSTRAARRLPCACAIPGRLLLTGAAALSLGFGWAGWRATERLAVALPSAWEGVDVVVVGVVDDLPRLGRGASASHSRWSRRAHTRRGRAARGCRRLVGTAERRAGRLAGARVPPASGGASRAHEASAWQRQSRGLRSRGVAAASTIARDGLCPGARSVQRARRRLRGRPSDMCNAPARPCATGSSGVAGSPVAGVLVALAIGDQRSITEAQWAGLQPHRRHPSRLHLRASRDGVRGLAGALAFRRSPGAASRLTTRVPARSWPTAVGVVAAFAYVLLAGARGAGERTLLHAGGRCRRACGWRGPGTATMVWLWALAAVLAWIGGRCSRRILALVRRGRVAAVRGHGRIGATPVATVTTGAPLRATCAPPRTRSGW